MTERSYMDQSIDPKTIEKELEQELDLVPSEAHAGGFDIAAQVEQASVEDEGVEIHIHGVDDRPLFFKRGSELLPVTITVAGAHSARAREADALSRKRKLKASNLTGESLHDDTVRKTAYCTLRWQGFTDRGKEVPLSEHNAAMIYKRCPWVLNQVIEGMNDHDRFFKNGSRR